MKQSKIAVLVLYFGSLPSFFWAWLETAKANKTIDFFILTDDGRIASTDNVHVIPMSFDEVRKKIADHFDFDISLESPYKLCDFKPAYGVVFADLLDGYEWWGYCDVDLLLGDVRGFFTERVLGECDRCQYLGHLSIFRNTEAVNNVFKVQGEYPDLNYQDVFATGDAMYFDEYRGMYEKCLVSGIRTHFEPEWRNPVDDRDEFYTPDGRKYVVVWEDGHLFDVSEDGDRKEILYAHFFRRAFDVGDIPGDIHQIKVVPHSVIFNGGCSYSFVNWEMLSVRPDRGMLTPSH